MKGNAEKYLIIEGVLLAILGVLFFVWPIASFLEFIYICGAFLVVSSIVTIIRGFKSEYKGFTIFGGIINLLFGIILFFMPVYSTEIIILVFGIWATILGIYLFIISFKYHEFGFNITTLSNILLIILGLFIWFEPIVTIISTPYLIGIYFLVKGIHNIYIAFKL